MLRPLPGSPRLAALDIGGANIKAAGPDLATSILPFELWKRPEELARALAAALEPFLPLDALAVTMTGELCDCFPTKGEGVRRILGSVALAAAAQGVLGGVLVWRIDRRLASLEEGLDDPLPSAAANWLALAIFAGRLAPRGPAVLVDTGSTTTDIVLLEDGAPRPSGLTDTERLLAGELVYAGASRTPVASVVSEVPYRGRSCPIARELFATTRDAFIILGLEGEAPLDTATADGRPATREGAVDRLARMICADREAFGEEDARAAAEHIARAEENVIARGIGRVLGARRPAPGARRIVPCAIVSGSGEVLAGRAASGFADRTLCLSASLGRAASAAGAAYALRILAEEGFRGPSAEPPR